MNIKSLKIIAILSASALCLCSCQKEGFRFREGDAVRFSVGSAGTKAAYSGDAGSGTGINWQVDDTLRIYCAAVSEPECKYADYRVSSVESTPSKARISGLGGVGLRWGAGEHTFYAAWPSPAVNGITTDVTANTVAASLPAEQAVAGDITETTSGNYVAAPDLKNMLMTAKSGPYTEGDDITGNVFLSFTPLTTAVQFTVTNQTGADIKVVSVSLISGNGKESAPAINGAFSVDMDNQSVPEDIDLGAGTITYSRAYPSCTRDASMETTTEMSLRTSTITFPAPVALAYDEDPEQCGTLTFTFFLTPTCNFDDLTFSIEMTDSDGDGLRTLSTRIGYLDGTGVLFPRFKKSEVTGVFIPEGAQWTIKYQPDVVSWNAGDDSPVSPQAGVSEVAVVTSWNTGVNEELELVPASNDLLPGKFSVSASEYVQFSRGNLQATLDASGAPTEWKFARQQYEVLLTGGANKTIGTAAGDIDLFGWSGSTGAQYGISMSNQDSAYSGDFIDWGTAMNPDRHWITLSSAEWDYLAHTRITDCTISGVASARFLHCTVGSVSGLMLFPDEFVWPAGIELPPSSYINQYCVDSYSCSLADFNILEQSGVVMLPVGGYRDNNYVTVTTLSVWSSTPSGSSKAYITTGWAAYINESARNFGRSVRLVKKFEKSTTSVHD